MLRRGDTLYLFYGGGYNNDPQQIGSPEHAASFSAAVLDRPLLANGGPASGTARSPATRASSSTTTARPICSSKATTTAAAPGTFPGSSWAGKTAGRSLTQRRVKEKLPDESWHGGRRGRACEAVFASLAPTGQERTAASRDRGQRNVWPGGLGPRNFATAEGIGRAILPVEHRFLRPQSRWPLSGGCPHLASRYAYYIAGRRAKGRGIGGVSARDAFKLGIVQREGLVYAETHVKKFMIWHAELLRISAKTLYSLAC